MFFFVFLLAKLFTHHPPHLPWKTEALLRSASNFSPGNPTRGQLCSHTMTVTETKIPRDHLKEERETTKGLEDESSQCVFTIGKNWKQPKCLSKGEQINKNCELFIHWNMAQQQNSTNYCYMHNRNESQKHYVERKNPTPKTT